MSANGQILNPIATTGAMPCVTYAANLGSCVGRVQLGAGVCGTSSYNQCHSLVSFSHNSAQNKLFTCSQVEPKTQEADVVDFALVAGITFLTVLIAVGVLSTAGHLLKGPRATWLNLPYIGEDEKQGTIRWTVSGLSLFQQWLQEKLIAACTVGITPEAKAIAELADVEHKELKIPEPILMLQRMIPMHQSLRKKGWKPYEKLSTSGKLSALMSMVKCERTLDAQGIEVIRLPIAILKLRHKDGREKQIELSELCSYADNGTSGSVQIFRELFDLQTSDEWYAKWCELFSNKALSELSIRIAQGETSLEIDDDDIASVSVEHDSSFIRLRHKYDHFDFDPEELDDAKAQIELLEEYNGFLDQLEDIPLAEKADAAKMRFAYLITRHLNGKKERAPKASPFLFSASELQELIRQNPEFFDTIEWKDIPRQVRRTLTAVNEDFNKD